MSDGLIPVDAIGAIARAEVDQQVATAKRYPRQPTACLQRVRAQMFSDADKAASCFYRLERRKRDGTVSVIEGPSIRLAEAVAAAWGNMRIADRVVSMDDKSITAQAVAFDLEANLCHSTEVRVPIVDRQGRRFSEDMIAVTAAAAAARARRNAIIGCLGKGLFDELVEEARQVTIGSKTKLADRIQRAVAYWGRFGVKPEQIAARVGVQTVNELTEEHLAELLAVATAIRDGETTIDDEFPDERLSGSSVGDGSGLPAATASEAAAKALAGDRGEPEPHKAAPYGDGAAKPPSPRGRGRKRAISDPNAATDGVTGHPASHLPPELLPPSPAEAPEDSDPGEGGTRQPSAVDPSTDPGTLIGSLAAKIMADRAVSEDVARRGLEVWLRQKIGCGRLTDFGPGQYAAAAPLIEAVMAGRFNPRLGIIEIIESK